jgi:hypothetical protein
MGNSVARQSIVLFVMDLLWFFGCVVRMLCAVQLPREYKLRGYNSLPAVLAFLSLSLSLSLFIYIYMCVYIYIHIYIYIYIYKRERKGSQPRALGILRAQNIERSDILRLQFVCFAFLWYILCTRHSLLLQGRAFVLQAVLHVGFIFVTCFVLSVNLWERLSCLFVFSELFVANRVTEYKLIIN